ncbi:MULTISPECIES: pitrilysin family protein [unclassified Thermosynechococcus]|uniref:M16 family metallopeptidase n=2 Tax=unclassified Thermosynechococcus TaxID=2622553 RepID=UPI002872B4B0|nr:MULTISPECIES: pitrilysin family protein [unclassified Thermosynechococcus]WNC40692.1 pitrilysin family protein [Thermosynechococcus sp. WL17]WNC43212.1 pitrilysin family protein [Thermosynechococcus sp. WL15]WNC45734.1 pitrilysin family protein [Thermosynechococcus sp. GLH187]WNC48270.1 pitrilysin family protein [Thermosynechococcus sp. GLH333]WNC50803.1 pitrilysin family protein [Thermosynechococcus sp. GLH87]
MGTTANYNSRSHEYSSTPECAPCGGHLRGGQLAGGQLGLLMRQQRHWQVYFWQILLCLVLGAIALSLPADAQTIRPYIDRAMDQISEFYLDNGMHFIVMEQHQAPIVSFLTYVDVGGVDEPEGQTGVAHYLEHLAFKGTRRIGTTDYAAEKEKLAQLDRLFEQLQATTDERQRQALITEFAAVQQAADRYVIRNQYGQIVQQAGGVGLNATTSADATRYFYSFPANKLELWMSLESERFLEPVFRDFYQEKEVILEERRLRTENSPTGQLFEAFLATSFRQHPYRRPVIGYREDIQNLRRADVERFFRQYYTPDKMTMVLVGDVDPQKVKELAKVYFSRYPKGTGKTTAIPPEPPQTESRQITLELASQPLYIEAYPCPPLRDPAYLTYEILTRLLSGGRTSRLYRSLVLEQKLALNVQAYVGFPGNKYPNRFLIYGAPAPGQTTAALAAGIAQELKALQTTPVTAAELDRVKAQLRMELLQNLMSNEGMAKLLAEYAVKGGGWQQLFARLEAINDITPADIQRVAQSLQPQQRTVAQIQTRS